MKADAIRLTTAYPSVAKMAKTLGASKYEVKEAKRLVHKVVKMRMAAKRGAERAAR